jgi:hypothetical protein
VYLEKLLSLTILFCCLLLSNFAFGKEQVCKGPKPVNIVIVADAFEEERALQDYELKETMQKRSGEWRFVRVHSEQDIQNALQLNPGECIKTMIVQGLHTSWEDGKLKAAVRYGEGGRLVYRPIDFDSAFSNNCAFPMGQIGFGFSLFPQQNVRSGCDSNSSKFTEGALIVFNSCHLAPEKNPDLIFKRLKSIFKLEKASVYANYTYGVQHISNMLAVPCYEGSQGGLVKSMRTLFQAVWPLTLVVNGSAYALQNKGYLASINGDNISYSKSKFQDAIKIPDQ